MLKGPIHPLSKKPLPVVWLVAVVVVVVAVEPLIVMGSSAMGIVCVPSNGTSGVYAWYCGSRNFRPSPVVVEDVVSVMGADTGVAVAVGGGAAGTSTKSSVSVSKKRDTKGFPSSPSASGPGGDTLENCE